MLIPDLAFWLNYRKHAINGGFHYGIMPLFHYYYCYPRLGFLKQRSEFKVFIRECTYNQHLWKGGKGSWGSRGRNWIGTSPNKGVSQTHRELSTGMTLQNCHWLWWGGWALIPLLMSHCWRQALDKSWSFPQLRPSPQTDPSWGPSSGSPSRSWQSKSFTPEEISGHITELIPIS